MRMVETRTGSLAPATRTISVRARLLWAQADAHQGLRWIPLVRRCVHSRPSLQMLMFTMACAVVLAGCVHSVMVLEFRDVQNFQVVEQQSGEMRWLKV